MSFFIICAVFGRAIASTSSVTLKNYRPLHSLLNLQIHDASHFIWSNRIWRYYHFEVITDKKKGKIIVEENQIHRY